MTNEEIMNAKCQEVTAWLIDNMQQHPERMEEIQARAIEALNALNALTAPDDEKVVEILTKLKNGK